MDSEYLFDAKEMIDAFHMEEFLTDSDDLDYTNGAFLIITDSQCIVSYNKDHGRGLHVESMANALFEIWGREKDEDDIPYIFPESEKRNIMASMVNEPGMSYIIFHFKYLESISRNQLELFRLFVDKYNDLFKKHAMDSIDSFTVYMENEVENEYHDLEDVYQYLEKIVDYDKTMIEDKVILGEVLEKGYRK